MTDHLGYRSTTPAGHRPGQHTQREKPQKPEGRFRRTGTGDAPRPPGDLQSQDRGQRADPLDRLRRQDHLHVRPRDDDAGDPRAPGRDLRDRRSTPTLISNVTDAVVEEVEAVAGPAAGRGLSHRVPGRADGEGARRGPRPEQGHLCGAGREPGRAEGSAGAVGGAAEGAKFWLQVLSRSYRIAE